MKKILLYLVVFGVLLAVSIPIHEAGHAITTVVLGGTVNALYVFPGIEVLPDLGKRYEGTWPGWGMWLDTESGPNWGNREEGLVWLMGSGINLLLAVAALIAFLTLKPSGIWKVILIAESLMFLDILLYTVLPQFGLRHGIILGGDYPEPLYGAEMLGIIAPIFTVCVVLVSVVMTSALIAEALRRSKTSATSR